jgi:hypothetical protein
VSVIRDTDRIHQLDQVRRATLRYTQLLRYNICRGVWCLYNCLLLHAQTIPAHNRQCQFRRAIAETSSETFPRAVDRSFAGPGQARAVRYATFPHLIRPGPPGCGVAPQLHRSPRAASTLAPESATNGWCPHRPRSTRPGRDLARSSAATVGRSLPPRLFVNAAPAASVAALLP